MSTTQGDLSSSTAMINSEDKPDHLLVLVHGIMGSPNDWTYCEAELKRRLGKKFLVHVSSCNMYTKTFTGIDGAGRRLADEVLEVVKKEDSLKMISFLAHSFSGLIARYAIAVLYTPNVFSNFPDDTCYKLRNLISLKRCQLFLTDEEADKPPLLLRMASDCDEGKFLFALAAFRCRVLYANVSYDHMISNFDTGSLQMGHWMATNTSVLSESPNFPSEAAEAKEAAQNYPSTQNTVEYHEIMEDEMIRGLQRLGWMKVDVSFHSIFWPFFAHFNIQGKNERFHNAGAGVVAHVADTIKQQNSSPCISVSRCILAR
ncbi:hypothetical protein SASPL_124082 [Salvia splendens]|uniref:DUF676 domain-containing protein n=1 Tax=Salvia splendens TaxID=180675 RepID=A0A8X8XPU3_SALSN|nr:hypothetical protein SASPL_124082 [Salvia splendens]